MKRAFTLIELLVVIAIIAILAAILFPVFAQAKEAAKKTAALTNVKQLSTSMAIYLSDSDDNFPLGYRFTPSGNGGAWRWNFSVSTPVGWPNNGTHNQPGRMAEDMNHWSNTIQPYAKNYGIYEAPGLPSVEVYNAQPVPGKQPAMVNLTYNGLLHAYSATAIAAPSQLPLLWNGRGKANMRGNSLTNPALDCPGDIATEGNCIYKPGQKPQTSSQIGGWMFTIHDTMWMYSKGGNMSFADTSAKFRRFGATVNPGSTDFRTDPYTGYNDRGNPTSFWFDGLYPWLFRPDYNFQ